MAWFTFGHGIRLPIFRRSKTFLRVEEVEGEGKGLKKNRTKMKFIFIENEKMA